MPKSLDPLPTLRRAALMLALLAGSAAAQAPDPVLAPTQFEAQIDDPMLAPVPPAPVQIESWPEARDLLAARSTDLRVAAAEIDRAEGRWRQALSLLLPNARFSASVAYDLLNPDLPTFGTAGGAGAAAFASGDPPSSPVGVASATVTQSVVDVGAWRGLGSAEASTRAAEANIADVRRRLTQGLATALVAVVAAERAAEINRLSLRQAIERALLTQRIVELGAGTQLDVVRVQQDVAVTRGALIAGDEQLRRAREALGLALGGDAEVGVRPDFGLDGLPEQLRQTCDGLATLEQRPDQVAARERIEAAERSREQASAGYLPTLGVTSNLVGITTDPGPGRFATWNIGAVLSVPLWEGGLRGGLVDERRAVETQAEEAAEATRRSASIEVARARRTEQTAAALLATATEVRALAERQDRLTRRSFEIGRATSLDLVQSAVALRQAELGLALRQFEWVQARLDAFLTAARCDR